MRTARKSCESDIYHVIARGVGRQLIFEDDFDRTSFLDLLASALTDTNCSLHAWCLMSNHVHLLVNAPLDDVSDLMKTVCGRYAQRFNLRHDRTGHLFQERFMSEPVEGESYYLSVLRYIHANPEKAHIESYSTYRWSSFGEYAGHRFARRLCDTEFALRMFGGREQLLAFHARNSDEVCMEADRPRSATRSMPDTVAFDEAKLHVEGGNLSLVKSMDKKERDEVLRSMKRSGLSIRQIERFTGVGRGIIQRA